MIGHAFFSYGKIAETRFDTESPDQELQLFSPSLKTARCVAQQCAFTASTYVLGDHAQLIVKVIAAGDDLDIPFGRSPDPIKIVIPAHTKTDSLSGLRRMNIRAGSLFPGIDGVGRSSRSDRQIPLPITWMAMVELDRRHDLNWTVAGRRN